jgi:hypothetical protein
MKIYAKQVPPEYQKSPLLMDWKHERPENLYIWGNRHFVGCNVEKIDALWVHVIEAAEYLWEMRHGRHQEQSWADVLGDLIPKTAGDWTRAERVQWAEILADPRPLYSSKKYEILCAGLGMLTGRRWDWCTLRGCCQSDWQECIYPADDWDGESLERLEAEYFNTGTEWIIHDEETPPECPEDVSGFSGYCTAWNDDGIKREIAEAVGGSPADVILYKFTGYARRAEYEEA